MQESQAHKKTQENTSQGTSDDLAAILEQLTFDQKRFIIVRLETSTDKEAAERIGLKVDRIYAWRWKGYPIDKALKLMAEDGLVMALHLRRKSLAKAMATKVGGLESGDEKVRQRSATEIIEWELGKPKQTQEISGKDGGPIETKNVEPSEADIKEAAAAFYRRVSAESGDRIPEGD